MAYGKYKKRMSKAQRAYRAGIRKGKAIAYRKKKNYRRW